MTVLSAIVLASPRARDRWITGLTLSERARRVCVRAGVEAERAHVVRSVEELPKIDGPVLIVRAIDQVVAAQLVEPLRLDEAGDRVAVDEAGGLAGAARLDRMPALRELAVPESGERVTVNARARHAAGTDDEARAAKAWQWALVNKPLDAFLTRRFWRPCARPLTKIALHLPFTPNMISVACIALSITGGVIAASAQWSWHAIGFGIYFFAALLDNVDGEVARLRLESSRAGGWIDTIGDDLARFAVIIGVFFHVASRHPSLPIGWLTGFTLFNAALANVLLYWWCIFVGKTYNNQEYVKAIGAAPHEMASRHGWKQMIADLGAQVARRDFLDCGVILLALLDISEVALVGLFIGQLVGVIIIVPIHLKIVKQRRDARAAAAAT